jgi:DNA (cytosine-5)-methyltransferase 1
LTGGFDLGFERAGMKCTWQCEIDDKTSAVLEKHWPEVRRYKDVRTIGKHNLESVDVICGGFPCQDVSLAGLRKGLEGKRSTLWSEFYRIVGEIRPQWVVIENVRGLLTSDDGRFFGKILYELSNIGYDSEWEVIRASDFGLRHRRERIFIIAYPKCDGDNRFLGDRRIFSKWEKETQEWGAHWVELIMDPGNVAPSKWIQPTQMDNPEPTLIRTNDGVSFGLVKNRLKQCGNAVCVPIAEWIGRRIVEVSS